MILIANASIPLTGVLFPRLVVAIGVEGDQLPASPDRRGRKFNARFKSGETQKVPIVDDARPVNSTKESVNDVRVEQSNIFALDSKLEARC